MGDGKVEFSIGEIRFSAEGEQAWLASQLDKVLKAAPGLAQPSRAGKGARKKTGNATGDTPEEFTTTLAAYIKEKKGESNQVRRFLATADWVRRRGAKELTTSAVTKALKDNHQKRLGNPADCLNKNVTKGHCEKDGDGFFITPDGLAELGDG